jgi:hypothetical protein
VVHETQMVLPIMLQTASPGFITQRVIKQWRASLQHTLVVLFCEV